MSLGLREHKLCLFETGVGRAGEVCVWPGAGGGGGSGSVAQTGEGSLSRSPGQHYWDVGFGVRKIQAHVISFSVDWFCGLVCSCGVSALQLSDL